MVTGGRTTGLLLRFDLSILADEESILNRSSIVSMDTRVEAASISLNSAEDIKDVWFLVVLFCRVGLLIVDVDGTAHNPLFPCLSLSHSLSLGGESLTLVTKLS